MRKQKVFFYFLCVVATLKTSAALSEPEDDKQNSAEIWSKNWGMAIVHDGKFPTIVTTIQSEDGNKISENSDKIYDLNSSFLVQRQFRDYLWDAKLNREPIAVLADLIANPRPPHIVVCKCQKETKVFLLENAIKKFTELPIPETEDLEFKSTDLFRILGYDGIVLDKRENLVLVGGTSDIFTEFDIQALAIANSEKKYFLAKKERVGSGLLEIKSHFRSFAVFEIIILGTGHKDLLPGTKILVQKT